MHDNGPRYVYWQLCKEGGIERAERWYEQKPEVVIEN